MINSGGNPGEKRRETELRIILIQILTGAVLGINPYFSHSIS